MSETKSLAAPKASFDRRAVVKGAAWSVPVIAAAIAAPAAAASAKTATVGFEGETTAVSYSESTAGSTTRTGFGAKSFYIQNTAGSISGTISGTIRISPNEKQDPAVGITTSSFTRTTLLNPALSSATAGKTSEANVFTANFSYTGTVAGGAQLSFPMGFYYRGATTSPSRNFTMTVTLTLPDRATALVGTTTLQLV